MKKSILLTTAMLFAAVAVCFAADEAHLGTWKLNEAKSTIAAGTGKNTTVVYETVGDDVKVTVDGVDAAGAATHSEWTGKFDGKDYPVTGDSTYNSRSYKHVDDNNLSMIVKKDGKSVMTGRVTVSADGKSRTVVTTGTNAKGDTVTSTAVYDKQ